MGFGGGGRGGGGGGEEPVSWILSEQMNRLVHFRLLQRFYLFGLPDSEQRLIAVVNELKEAPYTAILPAPSGVPRPEVAIVLC